MEQLTQVAQTLRENTAQGTNNNGQNGTLLSRIANMVSTSWDLVPKAQKILLENQRIVLQYYKTLSLLLKFCNEFQETNIKLQNDSKYQILLDLKTSDNNLKSIETTDIESCSYNYEMDIDIMLEKQELSQQNLNDFLSLIRILRQNMQKAKFGRILHRSSKNYTSSEILTESKTMEDSNEIDVISEEMVSIEMNLCDASEFYIENEYNDELNSFDIESESELVRHLPFDIVYY